MGRQEANGKENRGGTEDVRKKKIRMWKKAGQRAIGRIETKDLDAEYRCKDLCRRFIADSEEFVDIQPLCLRTGCSKCEFLQSIKWRRNGTIRRNGQLMTRP